MATPVELGPGRNGECNGEIAGYISIHSFAESASQQDVAVRHATPRFDDQQMSMLHQIVVVPYTSSAAVTGW